MKDRIEMMLASFLFGMVCGVIVMALYSI